MLDLAVVNLPIFYLTGTNKTPNHEQYESQYNKNDVSSYSWRYSIWIELPRPPRRVKGVLGESFESAAKGSRGVS